MESPDVGVPSISVGLPVYNGEEFIGTAIESILNQTFDDFELIISDNGSTDRTSEICSSFAARDRRVRFYRSDVNHGASWNFNRVVELARGGYFKWAAHDDVIDPTFLERCYEVMHRDPGASVAYSRVLFIDGHGQEIDRYNVKLETDSGDRVRRFRHLLLEWHLCFEIFGLLRTDQVRRSGMLGSYSHADGVLLERLALVGRFQEIPDYLFSSRRHDKQSMAVFGVFDEGHNDYHRYAQWFDTHRSSKYVFPTWRMLVEHLDVIRRGELRPAEAGRSLLFVARWVIRRRRPLITDTISAARQFIDTGPGKRLRKYSR